MMDREHALEKLAILAAKPNLELEIRFDSQLPFIARYRGRLERIEGGFRFSCEASGIAFDFVVTLHSWNVTFDRDGTATISKGSGTLEKYARIRPLS